MVKRFSYVVVGNGIAGITAVETLRAEDDSADIAVIADNPLPVYNRPMLKDFLTGKVSEDKLWMRPKSFYQDQQVHLFTGRLIDIEVDQHFINLQNGQQIGYHRLLLATGARARQPGRMECRRGPGSWGAARLRSRRPASDSSPGRSPRGRTAGRR